MVSAVVIASLTCVALIVTVLIKPEINFKKFALPLYPFVALLGAVLAVAVTPLTLKDCLDGILGAGAVNPLKILVLFLSVTAISVFLDEAGFFEYLASKVLGHAGGNQVRLFFLLYLIVSVLTVFTSNDIVILTFTPFVIYFCNSAKIKAMPYLIAEFTAANTWSMALIIGNPTNIYLATSAGIGFFAYAKIMLLPTLFAGILSCGVLYLIFRKSLKEPYVAVVEEVALKDKPMCILGGVMLAVCTVSLAISGWLGVEMWLECAICFGILLLLSLVISIIRRRKPVATEHTVLRLPYALIPFVLSMFVVSLSLDKVGATRALAAFFSSSELVFYGIFSYFGSNLINNIPMSVLFSSIITAGEGGKAAVFASVVGSNLGALFTPIGALAGIMFSSILKRHGQKFSPLTFIRYGGCVSVVSLIAALSALALVLAVF